VSSIAIIIPYYQRTPGILRGCIESILAQQLHNASRMHLIIVDDASPWSADNEIADVDFPPVFEVKIIKRENGGPGRARNTGLDCVPNGTDFVAFIDSDDRWTEGHLALALRALDYGYDFYFCDHRNLDQTQSHFEFLRDQIGPSALGHCGIPDELVIEGGEVFVRHVQKPDLFSFSNDMGLRALIKCFLAHISTTVFRYKELGHIRFNPSLRSAAEDYLFVLMMAHHTKHICFSSTINMYRGRGISMYMNAVSWDNEGNLSIILDNLKCFILASGLVLDSPRDSQLILLRISFGRAQFTYLWIRRMVKFRNADIPALYKAIAMDRGFVISLPATLFRVLTTWVRKDDFSYAKRIAKA
jgi:succinoglycan biosynthesis protein ExoW